jgi:hypothetical protein
VSSPCVCVRVILPTDCFEAVGRIFGSKKEEVAGGWKRLQNEELHNLYTSSDVRVIISRKMRWPGM